MAGAAPKAPSPRPIERVSPSLGEALLACPLRTAFRRDPDFAGLERGNTFSALGLVSHTLTEEVARGDFAQLSDSEREEAVASRFAALIAEQDEVLRRERSWATLPDPERWPGYGPTRRRLLRRLGTPPAKAGPTSPRGEQGTVLEVELRAPDLPLLGRPDRVERDGEGVHLVDLKSGWGEMTEMRPAHRRQLLIYAYVWHAVKGEWPLDARIERLDGSSLPLSVDPAEASAVAEDLLARRKAFNEAIESNIWAIASPSPEACINCAFRATCPPFFATDTEEWGMPLRSVLGSVEEVESLGGSLALNLSREAGDMPPEVERARVIGVPAVAEVEPGERVAVIDAAPSRVAGEVRVTWNSCVYSWSRARVIA